MLLLGILTITTNCDKETFIDKPIEELTTNKGTQIEHLIASDAPEIINAITNLTGKSALKSTLYSKTLKYKKAKINLDRILKIKNSKNITNYTFNILIQDSPINEFYNLIVNEGSDKKTKEPYVIKYVVDDDALDKFLANNGDFSYFKGRKYTISFKQFFDNYDTASKTYGDPCSPDGTSINNTGNGENGGINDIPIDNHLQTDPNQYSYGEPSAGGGYSLYLNSNNTSNYENTSYGNYVSNEAFTINTSNSSGNNREINVPDSWSSDIINVYVWTPYLWGSNGSSGGSSSLNCYTEIAFEYSDGTTTTLEFKCAQYQQKNANIAKSNTDTCPESEGEIGVLSSLLVVKEIYLCLNNELTTDQISFLQSSTITSDIHNFLIDENNCSVEAQNISIQAIESLRIGIEVDSGVSDFVDEEPVQIYLGTVSIFKILLDFSPRGVGKFKGKEASDYLKSLGETKFNFKQMRPLPTQTGFFNTKKGRYIYTKKGGWIDMAHFMFYAGKAYAYKLDGESNPIGEAVQDGYKQEASDLIVAEYSAYSYEDLPSDKFGAEFAVNYFNPDSNLTFGEQLANYLNNILNAAEPNYAPNYNYIPNQDSRNAPTITNRTTTPIFTH